MMKKGLLCTLASLLLGSCLTTFAGGAIPLPPPFFSDHIKLVLNGAASIQPEPQIVNGVLSGRRDRRDNDNNGVNNNNDVFGDFAIGIGLWLPLITWNDQQINVVTFAQFLPGTNVRTRNVRRRRHHDDNNLSQRFRHRRIAFFRSNRINWGVGFNDLYAFNDYWFVEGMVGGGISWYYGKAEFVGNVNNDDEDDTLRGGGADHPNVWTLNPFVTAELGLGMKVTEKSLIMLFANAAWVDNDPTFILAANNRDDDFINVDTQQWWVLIGLQYARSIVL
jgi:hypothetical protein